MQIGSIIQVTDSSLEGWYGCLMIVHEVKSWGVLAGIPIPFKGEAFLRLKTDQCEQVGMAALVPVTDEENDDEDD